MKKLLLITMVAFFAIQAGVAQNVLLKSDDRYIGGKLALGAVAGASVGFMGNYEQYYQDNIGLGGVIGYSGYTDAIDAGFYKGEWSYTNILIVATGTYHYDLLHNEKLDTWAALNLGYNVASVSWKFTSNTFNMPEPAKVSAGGFVFGATANARYKLTEQLFASASVGFGMGLLNIGVDYKF